MKIEELSELINKAHENLVSIETELNELVKKIKASKTKPWYDNIGKGVWCKVWDNKIDQGIIVFITDYNIGDRYPFISNASWRHAEPIKELKDYHG